MPLRSSARVLQMVLRSTASRGLCVLRAGPALFDDPPTAVHQLLGVLRALPVAVVPLLSRGRGRPPIEDDDAQAILSNERRRGIYELIEHHPGIPPLEVKRTLGLGGAVFDNHLNRLLRGGLIETRRSGRFVRLYLVGKAPPADDPSLLAEATKKVARALLREPGRTSTAIAAEVGLSRTRVNEHLRVLAAAGLAHAAGQGRQTVHEPTHRLREAASRWPNIQK